MQAWLNSGKLSVITYLTLKQSDSIQQLFIGVSKCLYGTSVVEHF